MVRIIELIATFLYHLSSPLLTFSLYLHRTFSTPFWKRIETGVEQAEDRLEEMRQLEYLANAWQREEASNE